MTDPASRRPPHVKPPAHLSPNTPVPTPDPIVARTDEAGGPKGLEPTRYGDWEQKGMAIDF
jgi:hypothetical protein